MEEHIITRKLFLPVSGLQVSQALPMGGANQLKLQIRVESGSAGTIATPAVARIQLSQDMENWVDSSFLLVTLGNAPVSGTAETFGSSSQMGSPWIRVKYTGGSIAYLITAVVRLFNS